MMVLCRLPSDKALSEALMISLLTHICVLRPQWVNVIETLLSLAAHELVVMTTSCTTSDNKCSIITALSFQCTFNLICITTVTSQLQSYPEESSTDQPLYQERYGLYDGTTGTENGGYIFAITVSHNKRDGVSNRQRLDMFAEPFVQAKFKENVKAPRHWSLWGESTDDRWIPFSRGQ